MLTQIPKQLKKNKLFLSNGILSSNLIRLYEFNTDLEHGNCFAEPIYGYEKGVRALRGYFGPPMRSKNESCSSQVSSY